MEIRILETRDAEQCLALRLEALRTNPEAFGSSYEEESQSPTNKYLERLGSTTAFTFGAFDQEKLVGMVGLLKVTHMKMNHKAEIVGMFVTPKHRGSGVGRLLLEAAVKKAKILNGVEQINLCVVTTNTKAKRLYESLGFKTFGTENRAIKIGETYYDEDHMVLFL